MGNALPQQYKLKRRLKKPSRLKRLKRTRKFFVVENFGLVFVVLVVVADRKEVL
jgi:hypothetical protein